MKRGWKLTRNSLITNMEDIKLICCHIQFQTKHPIGKKTTKKNFINNIKLLNKLSKFKEDNNSNNN